MVHDILVLGQAWNNAQYGSLSCCENWKIFQTRIATHWFNWLGYCGVIATNTPSLSLGA